MMVDWNKPVQTRDGRSVRVLCTDLNSDEWPVVLGIQHPDREEYVATRKLSGKISEYGCGGIQPHDIINVPEKLSSSSFDEWVYDGVVTHSRRVSVEAAQAYGNYRAKFEKENSDG